MRMNKGFTIVELVVVIIILGILAATALPRFVNLESEAYAAVADGVRGAFVSGVSMTKAKWRAQGSNSVDSSMDLSGNGANDSLVNGSGWIVGDTVIDCAHVLNILVEGGSTPITVNEETTGGVITGANAAATTTNLAADIVADDGTAGEWFGVGHIADGASDISVCYLAYAPNGFASGDPLVYFTYTLATGVVSDVTQGAF